MRRTIFIPLAICVVCLTAYGVYRAGAEGRIKREVLQSEQRRPAPDFTLVDLSGRSVALTDFRGTVLVVAFWATWCGPCFAELEEMKVVYAKYKDDPRVALAAISIDVDKARVAPHVRKYAYPFQVLLSDGKVEGPYHTEAIPKLYVIDATGNIRFQDNGFDVRGYNLKRLDWMIDAALR